MNPQTLHTYNGKTASEWHAALLERTQQCDKCRPRVLPKEWARKKDLRTRIILDSVTTDTSGCAVALCHDKTTMIPKRMMIWSLARYYRPVIQTGGCDD